MSVKSWGKHIVEMVVLALIAWTTLFFIEWTSVPAYFANVTGQSYNEISVLVFQIIFSVFGVYYFFIANLLKGFKVLSSNIIQGLFSIYGIIVSIRSLSFIWDTRADIRNQFDAIPFPIEPDMVSRNIKLQVLGNSENMLYAFLGITIIALLTATIHLSKKS